MQGCYFMRAMLSVVLWDHREMKNVGKVGFCAIVRYESYVELFSGDHREMRNAVGAGILLDLRSPLSCLVGIIEKSNVVGAGFGGTVRYESYVGCCFMGIIERQEL